MVNGAEAPSDVNTLAGRFSDAIKDRGTCIFFKQGIESVTKINEAFNALQQLGLEGKLTVAGDLPARVFVFHIDENLVRSIETEGFYRDFFNRFTDFISQVPEYMARNYNRRIVELARKGDVKLLLAHIWNEDKPGIESRYAFAKNLAKMFREGFSNPHYGVSSNFPVGYPILVPVFNFQWPEPLTNEEAKKAVDALKSYAKTAAGFGPGKIKQGDAFTDYEKGIASRAGPVVGFVGNQLHLAPGLMQIIAAPLYGLKAVPYNSGTMAWLNPRISNDTIFESIRFQRIERI